MQFLGTKSMVVIILFFLVISNQLKAQDLDSSLPVNREIAQTPQRFPNSIAYQRALIEKIAELEHKNEYLIHTVADLQIYRDRDIVLQARLEILEQQAMSANNQTKNLQAELEKSRGVIEKLSLERTSFLSELHKIQELSTKTEKTNESLLKEQQNNKFEFEKNKENANELTESLQVIKDSLEKSQSEAVFFQQKIKQLESEAREEKISLQENQKVLTVTQEKLITMQDDEKKIKQQSEQISWLNQQIQEKTKKINDLYKEIDALNQSYNYLKQNKAISESNSEQKIKTMQTKMDEKTSQLLEECKNKEAQWAAEFKSKELTIDKWRQDYDLLKKELDTSISINNELRKQNAKLENECTRK
jgi:chromosome segregation ATPase